MLSVPITGSAALSLFAMRYPPYGGDGLNRPVLDFLAPGGAEVDLLCVLGGKPGTVRGVNGHGDVSLGIGDWGKPRRRLMIRPCARLRHPAFYRCRRLAFHSFGVAGDAGMSV